MTDNVLEGLSMQSQMLSKKTIGQVKVKMLTKVSIEGSWVISSIDRKN